MKISIIIPVYNGEKYLAECLESVLKQDIEDKEIICVDDGSTDNSIKVIQKYQDNYPCIRLIQQPNMGAAVARNRALDEAKGKYIAFMDADDSYIDETGLRKMVNECERYKIPICGSFRTMMTEKGLEQANTYREEVIGNKPQVLRFTDIQFDYYYQSYVYERKFLNENKLRFPNLRRYQDPPFFVRTMWEAKEFLVIPVELYCYRVRTGVIHYSFQQINDILLGLKLNIEFAGKNRLNILYENSIMRLNETFYSRINDSIMEGNVKAIKILVEIQEIMNQYNILCEKELLLISNIKKMLQKPSLRYQNYQIPFDKIPYGSNVVIYGAGGAGKSIHYTIEKTGYCNIVQWVDKDYVKYMETGLPVKAPSEIRNMEFDYILIAVARQEVFEEIKGEIEQNIGKYDEKIIGPIAIWNKSN